jgi:sensor histidine kinase YesM
MKRLFDFKLLRILIGFYTAVSIISLLKIYYLKSNGFGYEYNSWKEVLLEFILLDWVIIVLFMAIMAITTKLMILKNFKWKFIIIIHAIFSLLLGFIIYLLSSTVFYLSGQIDLSEISFTDHLAGIISVIDMNFLIYIAAISIIYSYYYFQQSQKTKLEKAQISSQLNSAKLNILKYKLHPHFLFNTLNSISSLIDTNTKLAQDTIADFGDLLRDLLDLKDSRLITLEEEITICKRYIDIMMLRFSDNLKVTCNIPNSLKDYYVPSLILLPIVENSIKHGYSYNHSNLNINIEIIENKKTLTFKISNDGEPLKKGLSYGVGINSTIDRLNILYNQQSKFAMKNNANGNGITTTITIPKNS